MYRYKKQLNTDFTGALKKTKEKLEENEFVVFAEIAVNKTAYETPEHASDVYMILGMYNPLVSYNFENKNNAELMIPCNISIQEDANKIFVSALIPTVSMTTVQNDEIRRMALYIEERLKGLIDEI